MKENTVIRNFSETDIEIVNKLDSLIGFKLSLFFKRYFIWILI